MIAPQTTYTQRGPGGVMTTYSTPGAGSSSLFPGPSVIGGDSMWVWVGGGLALLVVVGMAMKK